MAKGSRKSRLQALATEEARLPVLESAAHRVYDVIELRQKIFGLVDRRTLAGMVRLEKAAVDSVAELLYKEMHVSVAWEMTRSGVRGAIYCDAVRAIDISPPPRIDLELNVLSNSTPLPKKLDAERILEDFGRFHRKFPHLRTIRNEHPANPLDDAYVVHLRDGKLEAELVSAVEVNLYRDPFPKSGQPALSTLPKDALLSVVTHGLAVWVTDVESLREARNEEPVELDWDEATDNAEAWGRWLQSAKLDRRVISLTDLAEDDEILGLRPQPASSFLSQRQARHCEPWRVSSIPHTALASGCEDASGIRNALLAMGRGIRVLNLDYSNISTCQGWQATITLLDSTLPSLEVLIVRLGTIDDDESDDDKSSDNESDDDGSDDESEVDRDQTVISDCHHAYDLAKLRRPLTGLPHLRKFVFDKDVKADGARVAANICRLGSAVCVFENKAIKDLGARRAYSDKVRKFKANRSIQLEPRKATPSAVKSKHKHSRNDRW